MRARQLFSGTALVALLMAAAAPADPVGPHFELTPFAGYTLFDGDLRHVYGQPLIDDLYFGGRLGYLINPWGGLEAAGGFTPTRLIATNATVDFYHVSGNVLFTPWAGRFGGPFLVAGGGTSQTKPASGSATSKVTIEYGGGVRLWLSDAIGLRLETRQLYYSTDTPGVGSQKITHLVAGGGLTFALGARPRDTDADGVPDRMDRCPDTPRGASVSANGCPIDSDGDGVFDGLDKCPGTPKGCTVDAAGCQHDADGDGVCDGLDTCADTPKGATVDAAGCSKDSDGDGVLDGLDQCPDTPKGATVDEKGCPKDSDGDGVPDGIDRCPDTPAGARVDNRGCPIEIMEKETELLDTGMIRLQNVNFETNKAALLPESYPVLDVVGQVLTKWPELRIEIGGHTDSRGTDRHNQKLSEARARAVLDYLTGKFPNLKAEQFSARGYGESRPLVPNTSPLNMAKNRRVEFVVLNKDVLKREVERRRLLQKDEGIPPPDTTRAAPPDTTRH